MWLCEGSRNPTFSLSYLPPSPPTGATPTHRPSHRIPLHYLNVIYRLHNDCVALNKNCVKLNSDCVSLNKNCVTFNKHCVAVYKDCVRVNTHCVSLHKRCVRWGGCISQHTHNTQHHVTQTLCKVTLHKCNLSRGRRQDARCVEGTIFAGRLTQHPFNILGRCNKY